MRAGRRTAINIVLAAACLLLFAGGGHFAATALIESQHARQIKELSRMALRRAEAAVDFGTATLNEISTQGSVACDPASLQAIRFHVYQRGGAVKDIRIVEHSGAVLCSAYSETLEFDQGWVTRSAMLPTSIPDVSLFRVDQFFGTALGLLRDVDANKAIVAIVGMNGAYSDIMPVGLAAASDVVLELGNGQEIAREGEPSLEEPVFAVSTASTRYPLRSIIRVETQALATWDQESYKPIMALSLVLGSVFAALLIRLANRPADPIQELDRAIANSEFQPYLQPLFDLETRAIVGAELLARWVRADGTVLPPSRFIELAERSGRMSAITWQLLGKALAAMQPLLKGDKRFKLSVNIDPRQFVTPGFVPELRRIVGSAKVATRQITLELTEREAFDDLGRAADLVAEVRNLGFKVAIDDVGIGHSGLSHIQRLAPDILKIDKFFVDCINRDASASSVVGMLVRLAHDMNMSIVAEGIETEPQVTALLSCGVNCGQGYLVAAPMPLPSFLTLVAQPADTRQAGTSAAGIKAA